MYKLHKNMYGEISCVICIEKEISIPFDLANTDYQEYLKWVSEGNQPLPADK